MEDFLAAHSVNPVTLRPVLVAKDVTFGESCFDHSYNLLVPLAMENTYVYIKTYICDQTNLPKNVIVVAEIPKIEQEGGNYFFTPPQVNNEKWKLTKGARYVPRMLEFFSPLKNPNLYAAVHNPNILLPPLKIYDTDKVQYQSSSGYVEILHQSTSYEGGMYSYLLLKSCRSKSAESSATAPRVFTLLNEEFEYFKEFLDWAQRAYTISLGDASIEQVRVRAATLGIHNVLNKRKTATTQSSEKQPPMKRGKKHLFRGRLLLLLSPDRVKEGQMKHGKELMQSQ